MKQKSLSLVIALLAIASFAQAGGEKWFGLQFRIDADGFFNPVVNSIKVEKVWAGSPAAKAGLAVGDLVVEMQGIKVAGAKASVLKPAMPKATGSDTLRLKFQRGSAAPREVTLVAAAKP